MACYPRQDDAGADIVSPVAQLGRIWTHDEAMREAMEAWFRRDIARTCDPSFFAADLIADYEASKDAVNDGDPTPPPG